MCMYICNAVRTFLGRAVVAMVTGIQATWTVAVRRHDDVISYIRVWFDDVVWHVAVTHTRVKLRHTVAALFKLVSTCVVAPLPLLQPITRDERAERPLTIVLLLGWWRALDDAIVFHDRASGAAARQSQGGHPRPPGVVWARSQLYTWLMTAASSSKPAQ